MEMVHFLPPVERKKVLMASQEDNQHVLIEGETGTGKGMIARWIHNKSNRNLRPFLEAVAGKSLSDQIKDAHLGTLVIPEIQLWPNRELETLVHYLKTQTVPFLPLGSNRPIPMIIQTRIFALITNAPSFKPAEAGDQTGASRSLAVKETLQQEAIRLTSGISIRMPPLKQRKNELIDIANGLVSEITRELSQERITKAPSKSGIRHLSDLALQQLKSYDWPGNIRELRNVLTQAILQSTGDRIDLEDLPQLGERKNSHLANRTDFKLLLLREGILDQPSPPSK